MAGQHVLRKAVLKPELRKHVDQKARSTERSYVALQVKSDVLIRRSLDAEAAIR
jgi:hypothetical protein